MTEVMAEQESSPDIETIQVQIIKTMTKTLRERHEAIVFERGLRRKYQQMFWISIVVMLSRFVFDVWLLAR